MMEAVAMMEVMDVMEMMEVNVMPPPRQYSP